MMLMGPSVGLFAAYAALSLYVGRQPTIPENPIAYETWVKGHLLARHRDVSAEESRHWHDVVSQASLAANRFGLSCHICKLVVIARVECTDYAVAVPISHQPKLGVEVASILLA